MNRDQPADNQQKPCNVCRQIPENIICLSCNHSICLLCATKVVFSGDKAVDHSLIQSTMNEIECPMCGTATLISEDVRDAFLDILENPEFSLGGTGEEENETEMNRIEGSTEKVGHSRRDLKVKDTTEGEEEMTDPQDTNQDASEDVNEDKIEDIDYENGNATDKVSISFDYLAQLPCHVHPEELYTHYSPILRNLLCPQCIIEIQLKGIEHNAKPLRKCHG